MVRRRRRTAMDRRLDMVRRRRTAMEMAGDLGTAARRAIRCKAACVSPIEVPSAAGGALGTVVRPAIRSKVASASRIAAIRNLTLHRRPSRQSHRVRTAAHEGRLCKKHVANSRRDFATRRSRFGFDFDGCFASGLVLGVPLKDSRHCAAPRWLKVSFEFDPMFLSIAH